MKTLGLLSRKGFVEGKALIDALLSHAIIARRSHSPLVTESISMISLVQQAGNDPVTMAKLVSTAYQNYLSRHYGSPVNVDVTHHPLPNETEHNSRYILRMSIIFIVDGERVNLAEDLHVYDGSFKRIINKINKGI